MKTIKTILILCVALCFATSCNKDVDMTLVQKTVFENADIRQIEVSDAWEVTVVADSNTFVELEYSAYLEEHIKAKMEGNELDLGFTGSTYPVISSVFRAIVHTSQLEKLEIEDAAHIQCNGEFSGQSIEIDLNDAAQCNGLIFVGERCNINMEDAALLTGLQFEGNTCKAILEDASQFNGQIHASDQFEIELESASRFVNKGGETNQASIKLQNASILNMVETQVEEMHIELTSGSEATVWVHNLLEGTLKEASILNYKGHPQIQVECSEDSVIQPI